MKVGVFVDVANIAMNGGRGMRYDTLHAFACRGAATALRLNAYVSFDPEMATMDSSYKDGQLRFHSALRDLGYKVILKEVKWYIDKETGEKYGKANADLDLAVDALLQSGSLDRVVLATGDGDFVQVVKALQNKGCRVEATAFDNVSGDLRQEVDVFTSGYLVPGLLPIAREREGVQKWGAGGFVRGVLYAHDQLKSYGWMRYLKTVDGKLWLTDSRNNDSPYQSVFCHDTEMPADFDRGGYANRNSVFEFRVDADEEGRLKASDVTMIKAKT